MVVTPHMMPIPPFVDCHLDALQAHKDGGLLLAASNLVSRYWSGSLFYFKEPDSAPEYQHFDAAVQVKTGVADVQWIDDCKAVSVSDTGSVDVWDVVVKDQAFVPVWSAHEHDDGATSVAVNADKKMLVSASLDGGIKVWDIEEMMSTKTFRGHSDGVSMVSSHPGQPDTFLSCSRDGNVILWDTRMAKPAKRLCIPLNGCPSCVCWQQKTEPLVAIGYEDGRLLSLDLRDLKNPVNTTKPHTRSVRRITFSPASDSLLASASEDGSVVVTDITQGSLMYRQSHKDFVTGLTWLANGSKLYSCGWDFSVKCHDVTAGSCVECGQATSMEVNGTTVNGAPQTELCNADSVNEQPEVAS